MWAAHGARPPGPPSRPAVATEPSSLWPSHLAGVGHACIRSHAGRCRLTAVADRLPGARIMVVDVSDPAQSDAFAVSSAERLGGPPPTAEITSCATGPAYFTMVLERNVAAFPGSIPPIFHHQKQTSAGR